MSQSGDAAPVIDALEVLQEIASPAAGADDAKLHLIVGGSYLLDGGSAVYRGDGGCHCAYRSGSFHKVTAGDILVLGHIGHLFSLFPPIVTCGFWYPKCQAAPR